MIGMACELANGIDGPQSYWNVLKNCIDIGSEIPKERFDVYSYASMFNSNKSFIRRGYFLNDNQLNNFDPSFFGITDGEAMIMDPCHRLLLKKVFHLIEDANYTFDQIRGSRTAVYIGQFTNDHATTIHRTKIEDHTLMGPNISLYNASSRLSYYYDLLGPNLTLDTACSSSLQAIHLAVQSLRNGEANLAVAGGANLNYTPETFFIASFIGAISPDGRSRSYSEDANGYAKGEGVGLVLLKRLSDAIRDKDKIYCVIRDVMASHDGNQGKTGYNVPSSHGQTILLNDIYMRSNIDPKNVFYIEGHGTGTQVGDPIEANTLGAFFKRSRYDPPLFIGSVKSVIGHTEGTAGVASLIKIALCMKYRMITPNMNFTRPNRNIQAMKYNLHIVNHLVQFPDELITIGINSFGIGGNNAHAIITEWSEDYVNQYFPNNMNKIFLPIKQCSISFVNDAIAIQNEDKKFSEYFILTFSSKSDQSLKKHAEKFSTWLSTALAHVSQTSEKLFLSYLSEKILLKRTTNFSHRLSFLFSDSKQLQVQLESYLLNKTDCPSIIFPQEQISIRHQANGNICFIYSGQGPQWWAMGRQLFFIEPIFRQWIEKIDAEFISISNNSFSLIKHLIEPENENDSQINQANVAQPAILAIQIGLTALWLSWGIRPKIIVGHSVGEVAAAFVAGRLTLRETVQVIYHRSRVQNYNTNQGGRMLALLLSENDTIELLNGVEDQVQIAAINSPGSVTLSGDGEIIENIVNHLSTNRPKVFKAWLKIQNAFHSKQMERFNIREELLDSLSNIQGDGHNSEFDEICSNAILYSTVTGTRSDQSILNGEYWWKNVRNPVLFDAAMQSILAEQTRSNGIPVFIEISPHPVLSAAIPECFQYFQKSQTLSSIQLPLIIHSLRRKENEQQTILSSLCQLFSFFGSNLIDWNKFWLSRSYAQLTTTNIDKNEILFWIDQIPYYTFNDQVCWYEPKDSVFKRRAIMKKHHPLLGYRLWHNEAQTPTWRNRFLLSQNSAEYSYLCDHVVQGSILFPAAGFIELVIAAVNQLLFLLSSQQQSIKFKNIQFLNALRLDENNQIQIETVIIMPFREFFIYSRRYTNDTVRLSGISGNDITTKFDDENFLNIYSSKEWTLHCSGSIHLEDDGSLISSIYDLNSILNRLSSSNLTKKNMLIATTENEINNLYTYFAQCGLKYGSRFQSVKTLHSTDSEVLTELFIPKSLLNDDNHQQYMFHPAIIDGSFQGMISIIPLKFYETAIPASIEELIVCDRKKTLFSIIQQEKRNLYAFQSLHSSIKGITPEETYTSDIVVFSSPNESSCSTSTSNSIMIFRGFKLEKIRDELMKKSIFERIDESSSIFNTNPKKTVDVNELINRFCAWEFWKPVELELFSSSTNILSNEQSWIIFADQKEKLAEQIATVLLQHEINPQNLILIYLSTKNNENQNLINRFQCIEIKNISLISSTIRDLIKQKSVSNNSSLNLIFGWSLDLPTLNSNGENNQNFQAQEEIGCGTLMHIIQSIYEVKFDHHPNIFILTQNGQLMNKNECQHLNLNQSPIIGFARSLINEYPINRMKLIDIQTSSFSSALINALINEMNSTISCSSDNLCDEEVILTSSENDNIIQRLLPIYQMIEPSNSSNLLNTTTTIIPNLDSDHVHFRLQVPKSRLINDLQWIRTEQDPNDISLAPTQVQIQIYCIGLTFRDMLKVRGLHPHLRGVRTPYDSDKAVGMDYSGKIIRKGSQVKFNIGDQIFGIVLNNGAFHSQIIVDQNEIAQASSHLTMEQLSVLPTYLTAFHCLRDCIYLQAGQTILIHSAASAVGLALIQYCRMVGAQIIATAGNDEKRQFLREHCGIEHVFNSRNLSFVTQVRQITPNGVVDIIVNSLSGHFISESLKLLAPYGHFIELGKRDVYANTKLSLLSLRPGLTFHVIDAVTLHKYYPEKVQTLLQYVSDMSHQEKFEPLMPIKIFEASQIQDAFATYAKATHIGKFVIRICQSDQPLQLHNSHTRRRQQQQQQQHQQGNMFSDTVCNHGTILISGGLGGLSIDMSKWMIKERAVKRIVLLSRRSIDELDQNSSQYKECKKLEQVAEQYQSSIQVMKADVKEFDQVLEVIRHINQNPHYPVRGIIHTAMILHDCLLKNMTPEILSTVMQPKIRGAWNLHCATEQISCPIEFFIMFSSIRNHIADSGQSNYNAGNNFLDALAHWRWYSKKVPALSISLPAISGAGYLQQHGQSIVELMREQGIHLLPTIYVFLMIEELHRIQQERRNISTPVMFVVDWRTLLSMNLPLRLNNLGNEYINTKEEKQETLVSSNDTNLIALDIESLKTKIRLGIAKIFNAINTDRIDFDRTLVDQGMDSLRAIEIRTWLAKETSVMIPLVDLLQGSSISDLALYIQNKLLNRQTNVNMIPHLNNIDQSVDIGNDSTNHYSLSEKETIDESQIYYTGISLISPLYYSASKSSLFCIHDMIGLSETFIKFAVKMVETYQNQSPSIFAFRASGYGPNESLIQSIPNIAEEYIFQMKRIQPIGPYNLVGYSFGGLVAYEMVRQLNEKHQATVRSLILIDPPIPTEQTSFISEQVDHNQFGSLKNLEFIYKYLMKDDSFNDSMDSFNNSSLVEQEKVDILMQKMLEEIKQRFHLNKQNGHTSLTNHSDLMTDKVFDVIKAQMIALQHYTFESAVNSHEIMLDNQTIMFTLTQNNSRTPNERKHKVWRTLLPNLRIEQVDGTHAILLEIPTVNIIVNRLKEINIF
ncbi:unnamed protein product [Rotaria sordida]|uniref:Polyketide synthase n=1 Tax=Rotaria sordida TaxID=392033 RepID=A0A814RJ15_9BILA|nr:unnamed protein product [Rotaria sordida]